MTDHRPLDWLNSIKDTMSRLHRWKVKLSEYEYTVKYKPGRTNAHADALTRNPCVGENSGSSSLLGLAETPNVQGGFRVVTALKCANHGKKRTEIGYYGLNPLGPFN